MAEITLEDSLRMRAMFIAAAAPWERGDGTECALIPWRHINRLRDLLDQLDTDWTKHKAKESRPS